MTQKVRSYIFFPVVALIVGSIAGWLSMGSFSLFEKIQKPFFAPPTFLFPIVWTILYLLMGIGAARVSQRFSPERENAIMLFAVQLVINFFWPIIFFVLQAYTLAFIWLCILFILAITMTIEFGKVERPAALMQIPYLAWLVFAGVLNVCIAAMN